MNFPSNNEKLLLLISKDVEIIGTKLNYVVVKSKILMDHIGINI